MAISQISKDKEVYIADYEHSAFMLAVLFAGMSDIYPVEDLWLANTSMGSHLREIHSFGSQAASGKKKIT